MFCIYESLISNTIPEEKRISSIDDLHNDIRSLNNSPELFPNFDVLLIRGDMNSVVRFFDFRKRLSPFNESKVFKMVQFFFRHFLCPFGFSRNSDILK